MTDQPVVDPPIIVPDLLPLAVDVETIHAQVRNPRHGDIEMLRRMLRKFGQRKPITVQRSTGEITAGSHTYLAGVAEGMPKMAVVWTDDDDATAVAWSLGDNHAHEAGRTDQVLLDEMVEELARMQPDLIEASGFDLDAVLDELAIEIPDPPALDPDRPRGFVPGRKKNPDPDDDSSAPAPGGDNDAAAPQPAGDTGTAPVQPPHRPDDMDPAAIAARNAAQEAADSAPPDDSDVVLFMLGDLRATVDKAAFDVFRASLIAEVPDRAAAGHAAAVLLGFSPEVAHQITG